MNCTIILKNKTTIKIISNVSIPVESEATLPNHSMWNPVIFRLEHPDRKVNYMCSFALIMQILTHLISKTSKMQIWSLILL